MKSVTPVVLALLLFQQAWAVPRLDPEDIARMHWLDDTAMEARLRTEAAAGWLDDPISTIEDWSEQIEARRLMLERQRKRPYSAESVMLDGMLGWLVHARARPLDLINNHDWLAKTLLQGFEMPVSEPVLRAGEVWKEVEEKLTAGGLTTPSLEIAAYWAGLYARFERASPAAVDLARAQATRAAELAAQDGHQRLAGLAVMVRTASEASWLSGDELQALWWMMDALSIQLALLDVDELEALAALVATMSEADSTRFTEVDTQLPVVLAQLGDSVSYLATEPPLREAAIAELADAYFRLAFLVPDASFYLDQPVRDRLAEVVNACLPNPDLVGPLPRNAFERCSDRLIEALEAGLDSQELVGGEGPFAPEFLRREASLLSWQRARYLDGHLDWKLGADCEVPPRANSLEWSILAQSLSAWVPQRPVFFQGKRWPLAVGEVINDIESQFRSRRAWLDCLTGQGGQRIDPVSRLLILHGRALSELDLALERASSEFMAEQTREGADIDLEASTEQQTTYRPEDLVVQPCGGGTTCGARVALPVSRALLGLFPNTYLLADQLGMGRLKLCYNAVQWADREMRPARPGDDRVANYFGRLSFELVGQFESDSDEEEVFRQRLKAAEPEHYLFAASDPALLDQDCAAGMAGEPVSSNLPEERFGLVPDRLTYFAATPVTPNALLAENWDQGAEWRDWFITGDRTEIITTPRPASLQLRVQEALASMVVRRERSIAERLFSYSENDDLSAAFDAVANSRMLLRRVLEINYPLLVRHDPTIRALLTGTGALVGREQVRRFIDSARPLGGLAAAGSSRLADLQSYWETLPEIVREQGQDSPEARHALRLLTSLLALSPPAPEGVAESSPAP